MYFFPLHFVIVITIIYLFESSCFMWPYFINLFEVILAVLRAFLAKAEGQISAPRDCGHLSGYLSVFPYI